MEAHARHVYAQVEGLNYKGNLKAMSRNKQPPLEYILTGVFHYHYNLLGHPYADYCLLGTSRLR